MPRRVIRSKISEDASSPKIIASTSLFQKGVRRLSSIFSIIGRVFMILWSIFERIFLVALLLILTIGLAWWTSQRPSLYRDWEAMDAILPSISWSGDIVNIANIRNHEWQTDHDFIPGYYSDRFDLANLQRLSYIITPFSDRDGPAHTMLSFSFSGGQDIVISAELRKERGESFDALKGILNQFEIQYIIASEDDIIKLRTNYRKNQVYMYPIDTPKEKIQVLFRSMLIRTDKLAREPEFYNTLWNNCTTTILHHANALREEKLPWNSYTILPSHSDELVYGAGLIDTSLSLEAARAYYRINEIARNAGTGTIFSEVIRKERK